MAGHRIASTVHVEAGVSDDLPGWETAWLDRFDRTVVAARHVARVDLTRPDAPERVVEEARHPRIAGFRHILSWHPDPALRFAPYPAIAREPAFRAGLRAVRDAGLAFDLMIYPHQANDAEGLARAHPGLLFVLDHCGSPVDRSPEGMAGWRATLARLATLPNLRLKISNPFAYDPDWTPSSIGAVLDVCLTTLGPNRCLFGTDAPVSDRQIAPGALVDLYLDLLSGLSPDEQRAVFHDTAAATYRLPLLEGPIPTVVS